MAKHKSTFPFKFKHNLDIDITFSAELDLPENPAIVARFNDPVAKHFEIGKEMLQKLCKTLDEAIELKLAAAKNLSDAGKQAEAKLKVDEAGKLEEMATTQVNQKIAEIKTRAKAFIDTWWAGEAQKDTALRNYKINVAIVATGKITIAATATAGAIAVAVVSHGAALPIAAAAVTGSVSLASKAYAALSAAFADLDTAYLKMTAAYTKAVLELEKTKIKDQKPDKSRTDKLKAFFQSAPTKELEEKVLVYKTKSREADKKLDSYGAELTKLMDKQTALKQAATTSPEWKAKADKVDAKVKYLMQKLDFLNKKTVEGNKAADKATQLIASAKAGKPETMGAQALDGFKTAATASVEGVEIVMSIAELVAK